MIITADQDGSDDLISFLTNGTTYASPSDTGVERGQIQWIDDVEKMLEPIKKEFAVYETTVFEGRPNATVNYN